MRQEKFWFTMSGILAVLAMALMLPAGAGAASKYKVLHRFMGADGSTPVAGLIFDAAGNLYGTTQGGGASNQGTVFKLTPKSNGTWTESVLHSFGGFADGVSPQAGLIFDTAGNLYGTTVAGGLSPGHGTVFKLTPNSNGSWTESVLYSFQGGADGDSPYAGLIFDAAGNLYGTTYLGGGDGVVFKLAPNADGSWTESVLYSFCSLKNCADGAFPLAGVIFDAVGNLYGTTSDGGVVGCGPYRCGTVFKLTPNSDGSWTESVLHSFTGGADGARPLAGLILDQAGNFYGTTQFGGNRGSGVVFKLAPNSNGGWNETVLHYFQSLAAPSAVIFDAAGSLYGTTENGGPANGGAVFKLAHNSNGSWAFSVLRFFFGKPALNPAAGVVLDKAGNLYGTTFLCGTGYNCQGVVFEITP